MTAEEKGWGIENIDRELSQLVREQRTRIRVVGIGGAGGNSLTRMKEVGIEGTELIAINTDAQDLSYTNADSKLLIGRGITHGLGTGNNPILGEQSARESIMEIKKKLLGADMLFITCGLGGGTGTGAAPVIGEMAKKMGMLTVGVVTLPFSIEGKERHENAFLGLEKLKDILDTLIVIPNDKLLDLAPELSLHTAFRVADELLTNAVKGTTELITKPGLVNLDFADIKTVMSGGGVALIGIGESDSQNRAEEAVANAIDSPLLDVTVEDSTGALVNIIGGKDLTLDETKQIVEIVSRRLGPEAKLIWGAQISEEMGKALKIMLIVTGVKSPQIMGTKSEKEKNRDASIAEHLGDLGVGLVE